MTIAYKNKEQNSQVINRQSGLTVDRVSSGCSSNYVSIYDTDEMLFVRCQLPFDDEHVPTLFRKIKCEALKLICL